MDDFRTNPMTALHHPANAVNPYNHLLAEALAPFGITCIPWVLPPRRGNPRCLLARLRKADGTQRLLRLAQGVEAPPLPEVAPSENTISGHAHHFAEYIHAVARARALCCWVDMSPNHVFCLVEIEKHLPEARFLHLIRDGRDVTASLCDAMQRYPDWSGRYRGVRGCMRTWKRAVRASAARAGYSRHIRSSRGLIYDYETWKAGVKTGSLKRTSKFRSLFKPAERARIERGLKWAGRPPEDLFAQAATRNNTT